MRFALTPRHRSGREHVCRYVSEEPLEIGDVVRMEGRYRLIESIEPDGDELSGTERDFAEFEEVPNHELEHALARRQEEELPEGAAATLERAETDGSVHRAGRPRPGRGARVGGRLVDSGALRAASFERVRTADIQ